MAEIAREFRLFLYFQAIAAFIFAFLYLVITDNYLEFTEWPYSDPYYPRAFGGTLLVLGFFNLIAAYRKEWDHIRIIVELSICWLIMVLIMNILELIFLTLTTTAVVNSVFNTGIVVIFLVGDIFFYLRERK